MEGIGFCTEKCIICLKKADYHTGHVRLGNISIIAGWCEEHHNAIIVDYCEKDKKFNLLNRLGCFGGWHESYGIRFD